MAGANKTRLRLSEGPPVGQTKPDIFSLTIYPKLEWILQVDRRSTLLIMRGLAAQFQAFALKRQLFN